MLNRDKLLYLCFNTFIMEIWKTIDLAPKYEVSNLGRIRHKKTLKQRKVKCNSKLYDYIGLSIFNGKTKQFRVHRLVALAFIANPDCHPIVNHIDGDKNNNRADNLEWCTYSYNTLHAYKNGLITKNHILDKKAQECVKYLVDKEFVTMREIAKALSISSTTVQNYCK